MPKYVISEGNLVFIASTIRSFTGKTDPLTISGMISGIYEIGQKRDDYKGQLDKTVEKNNELTDQNRTLKRQNADLTAQNTELTTQNSSLTERVNELTMECTNWETDYADLTEQNLFLDAEITELKMEKAELEDQKAELEAEHEDLTERIAELEAENAELKARIEELESGGGGDKSGAYTADGTFSNMEYTWYEMVVNFENGTEPSYGVEEYDGASIYAAGYDVIVPDVVTDAGWISCKNIVLPATTTRVGCTDNIEFEKIYIKAETPPELESGAFDEMVNSSDPEQLAKFAIVVPAGCRNAYISDTNWSIYEDYIEEGAMPI